MTPRAKLALAGIAVAGGVAAYFASTGTAKAASAPAQAPKPHEPWPSDNMPWMMYSATTASRQRAFNDWIQSGQEGSQGFEPLAVDGVLGPLTCEASKDWSFYGGPEVPVACWEHT